MLADNLMNHWGGDFLIHTIVSFKVLQSNPAHRCFSLIILLSNKILIYHYHAKYTAVKLIFLIL